MLCAINNNNNNIVKFVKRHTRSYRGNVLVLVFSESKAVTTIQRECLVEHVVPYIRARLVCSTMILHSDSQ